MSLQIKDTLSPALRRRAAALHNRKPILQAMGAEFVSLTKRAFTTPSLRAQPWPDKRDGTPATLRQSGALWQSIRVAETTNDAVTVGSDRKYAAIHQFGGKIQRGDKTTTMPARPFFPVLNGRLTPEAQKQIGNVAQLKLNHLLR